MSEMIQKITHLYAHDDKVMYVTGEYEMRLCEKGKNYLQSGHKKIQSIMEHMPQGPGDIWFYQVVYVNGSSDRIFNMSKVSWGIPEKQSNLAMPDKKLVMP